MKKFIVVLALVLVGVVMLPRLLGQTKEADKEKDKVANLMKRKLDRAQKVLDGIATRDYDKIIKNAEDLSDISKEASWRVLKTPTYEVFSGEFQRNTATLIKSAKDKNLDAATLAYVNLTLTCVKCHNHVREVRMVRSESRATGNWSFPRGGS